MLEKATQGEQPQNFEYEHLVNQHEELIVDIGKLKSQQHQLSKIITEEQDKLNDVINQLEQARNELKRTKRSLSELIEESQRKQFLLKRDAEHLKQLEEEYTTLLSRRDKLHNIDQLIKENRCLKDRVEQAEKYLPNSNQIRDFQRIQIVSACDLHQEELFHIKINTDFSGIHEVLSCAANLFDDVLEVWNIAYDSAKESQFIRRRDAYLTLQSLAWFGREYFDRSGRLGDDIVKILQRKYNLRCSGESETVQNNTRLRQQRIFKNNGESKEMLYHLKLGGGRGADKTLRIYFNLNRNTKKVEIGWCGRHLQTSNS